MPNVIGIEREVKGQTERCQKTLEVTGTPITADRLSCRGRIRSESAAMQCRPQPVHVRRLYRGPHQQLIIPGDSTAVLDHPRLACLRDDRLVA